MAYIKRRKYKSKVGYQAIVRRKGFKTSVKSFETKTDAKKWARAIERKFDTGNLTIIVRRLSFYLAIYSRDILARKNIKD